MRSLMAGLSFLVTVAAPVELYLAPHTHADVGWLQVRSFPHTPCTRHITAVPRYPQTVDSLSRMNVSRILDGVVGNLANDTLKRRRFVW